MIYTVILLNKQKQINRGFNLALYLSKSQFQLISLSAFKMEHIWKIILVIWSKLTQIAKFMGPTLGRLLALWTLLSFFFFFFFKISVFGFAYIYLSLWFPIHVAGQGWCLLYLWRTGWSQGGCLSYVNEKSLKHAALPRSFYFQISLYSLHFTCFYDSAPIFPNSISEKDI